MFMGFLLTPNKSPPVFSNKVTQDGHCFCENASILLLSHHEASQWHLFHPLAKLTKTFGSKARNLARKCSMAVVEKRLCYRLQQKKRTPRRQAKNAGKLGGSTCSRVPKDKTQEVLEHYSWVTMSSISLCKELATYQAHLRTKHFTA